MNEHWNIQIKIQRVQRAEQPNQVLVTPRIVDELLNVAVSADTEEEANAKAHRILEASKQRA